MAVLSASLAPASSPLSVAGTGPDTGVADHLEPAPFNDPELVHAGDPRPGIEQLGDRIAELSARIQAATYELLVLIRQFDEANGWSSCVSCAHWLSWRTGLAPGAAREHVRVARALGKLPKLSDAMRRGRAARGKSPAAFDRSCIPPDCVVPRSHMLNMLPRHALSAGRLTGLGATRGFATGC